MKLALHAIGIVLLTFQLLFLGFTQNEAQNNTPTGLSTVSGLDIMMVEDPINTVNTLNTLSYDSETKELSFISETLNIQLDNWSTEWLVALSSLLPSEALETFEEAQSLHIDLAENTTINAQQHFRMSGPFETLEFYNQDADLLLFIGNDLPLKMTWLAEYEAKIKTSGVVEGGLELTWTTTGNDTGNDTKNDTGADASHLITPNQITQLPDNHCVYLMALNESQSSDITGRQSSEWRFDVALFKCNDSEASK